MTGPSEPPLALIGAGGHARVVLALAQALGRAVVGVYDPQLAHRGQTAWRGIPVLGTDDDLAGLVGQDIELANGIGQTIGSDSRAVVHRRVATHGLHFATLVHPFSWVAPDVELSQGVQIMAGAVIQPGAKVGEGTIINTRASVDHDCHIGPHVHIAPGATLCGTVRVGKGAFIGAGAVVIQNVSIGSGAIVAAGATAVRDLQHGGLLLPRTPTRS